MGQNLTVIDRVELTELLTDIVQGAIGGTRQLNPRALTLRQLQDAYSISEGSVKRLRRKGMPCYMIGDSPRFDADEVNAWLKARGSK